MPARLLGKGHIYFCILGHDSYLLIGKPHQMFTQASSSISRYHSKERCAKLAPNLQTQSADSARFVCQRIHDYTPGRANVMRPQAPTLITCFCGKGITPRLASNVSSCVMLSGGYAHSRVYFASSKMLQADGLGGVYTQHQQRVNKQSLRCSARL